jgi:hypothetical protein
MSLNRARIPPSAAGIAQHDLSSMLSYFDVILFAYGSSNIQGFQTEIPETHILSQSLEQGSKGR